MNADPTLLRLVFVLFGCLAFAVFLLFLMNGSVQRLRSRLQQLAEENRALKETARAPKGWTHG